MREGSLGIVYLFICFIFIFLVLTGISFSFFRDICDYGESGGVREANCVGQGEGRVERPFLPIDGFR